MSALASMQQLRSAKCDPSDIHHSSGVTLSKRDAPKVREVLDQAFEKIKVSVEDSRPEELPSICNIGLLRMPSKTDLVDATQFLDVLRVYFGRKPSAEFRSVNWFELC